MHHLLEHINQDIKRRYSKDKDSTVNKTEYRSKRTGEIKVFYKVYFKCNNSCFTEILIKTKSKLTLNFLVFLHDPGLFHPCI